MKRHPFSVFSLVFGIVLILLAASIAFPARGWLIGTPHWLLPAAVILVGAALMSPLFTTMQSKKTPRDEAEGNAPGEATDTPPDHP